MSTVWDNEETIQKLNTVSNLVILSNLKKYGFPDDSEKRAKILKAIRSKREDNYPVTFDGLCTFLPQFEQLYDPTTIINNAKAVITGKGDYTKEVYASNLSNEEKEIILLSIPL